MEDKPNIQRHFLSGGGEMGERIRNFDWSRTTLGNPETWESSLKTCVRIMLTSPQPMFVWWGDELINIYNDAYRHVLGDKHPAMLGVPGNIVWKEIWEELWTRGRTVFEKNEGTFDDALLLIMNRYGYDEETYFKFSYNPIPGIRKTTEGLFCVCTEETQRIINERALDTLRKLGAIIFTEKSLDIIYRNVAEALASNNKDFPFALIYKITGEANIVTVAASTGIDKSQNVFPDTIDITKPTAITKDFCEAFRQNKMVVSEIKVTDITLPTGAWQTSPTQFIYLPVSPAGGIHPYCIISAALNPYRTFDETYMQFCQLIGDRVSIEINKMLTLEIESKRAEALAEIDRAKIVFFSNISHEFRTPLTLMLGPLETILHEKENNLNKSVKQNIEIAQRNALLLLKLVNTLLDFSNIERGKQQADFSLVDIVSFTKILTANFRSLIEKAGMKLIVKADTQIQPVYVDKQMWQKIVFNLLSNAFKYTLQGKITVEFSSEKDFAVLKIKDTGVGIPEDELPKMFERFHRIENAAGRTYEGTGIGLSLIKELVKLHNGEISVESVLGEGSVFTVKIPFGKEHVKQHQILKTGMIGYEIPTDLYLTEIETLLETENKEPFKIAATTENNHFPKILVVDDNADMRDYLSSILSNDFNVITAKNGMDALEKIKETVPTLVIADIMMPVMDGFGLLKELKGNKATETIPVIFLTALANEDSRIEGWETGADDYLVKPFSARELLSRVKAQIKMVKLRQSLQDNLRNVLLQSPVAIAVLKGPQHVFELANAMYLHLAGNNDVVGKSIRQAFPEMEGTGIYEFLDQVYSTGEPIVSNEMLIKLDKGNEKLDENYFNFVYQPSRGTDGKIDGVIMHGIDVTEQVLASKKIEESEQRLRLATLTSGVGVWEWNVITNKIRWDTQMFHIYGIAPTADGFVEYSTWRNAIAPGDLAEQERILQNTVKSAGRSNRSFKIFRASDGMMRDIEAIEAARTIAQGETEWVVGTNMDITDRKRATEKIAENEKQFSTLANNIQNLAWIANGDGWVYWYNQRWYDYTGTSLEEMKGWGWQKVHHPDHSERIVEICKKLWGTNEPFELTFPLRRYDGEYRWFLTRAVPINDENGNIISWIGTNTDIHDQKIQEEKKDEFISIASHEMKTPLTTAKAYIQLLELTLDDNEEAMLYAKKASQSVNRLEELTSELLDVSKIRLGKLNYTISTFNFNDMVDSTVENIQLTISTHTIIKTGKVYDEVTGDKDRLQQVVINLLSNAIKYSPGSEKVYITVEQENDLIKVSVKDTGIGIAPQSLTKIFEKYHRVEEDAVQFQGLGIGLFISFEIIQRHHGKLWAESELGKGSTFYFSLPVNPMKSVS